MKALPIPKKRPVPMVPPSAMNWICLDFNLRVVRCQSWRINYSLLLQLDIPSSNIAIFLSRFNVSIQLSGFSYATSFTFDARARIDISIVIIAMATIWRLIDSISFLLARHDCDERGGEG